MRPQVIESRRRRLLEYKFGRPRDPEEIHQILHDQTGRRRSNEEVDDILRRERWAKYGHKPDWAEDEDEDVNESPCHEHHADPPG
jgi:hypothetical protein